MSICRYYLIQFLPDCFKEKTTMNKPVDFQGNNVGKIETSSTKILSAGYMALLEREFDDEDEDEVLDVKDVLPDISVFPEGTYDGGVVSTDIQKKETKPPKRYTQTSLFVDMTRISRFVDDLEIKHLLLEKDKEKKGENGSIGTSATRAEIIKKLISIGYLEEIKEGKKDVLVSTNKGRKFYDLIPDEIKKADTTAKWWVVQENIKNGEASYRDLTESVVQLIREVMATFKPNESDADEFSFKAQILCKCPACGGDIVKGKFGPYCKEKCGFRLMYVFGKKVSEKQYISLCNGKKVKITGIKKKSGDGTFDAYAVSDGVEEFTYESNGKTICGKQLKLKMLFK
jgi:DNA topoisomerase-3